MVCSRVYKVEGVPKVASQTIDGNCGRESARKSSKNSELALTLSSGGGDVACDAIRIKRQLVVPSALLTDQRELLDLRESRPTAETADLCSPGQMTEH